MTLAVVMEPATFSYLFRHIDQRGHKSQSEQVTARKALGRGPGAPWCPPPSRAVTQQPSPPPTPRRNSAPH